jgi:hypothetical protein
VPGMLEDHMTGGVVEKGRQSSVPIETITFWVNIEGRDHAVSNYFKAVDPGSMTRADAVIHGLKDHPERPRGSGPLVLFIRYLGERYGCQEPDRL